MHRFLWNSAYEDVEWSTSSVRRWYSKDGLYRVSRVRSRYDHDHSYKYATEIKRATMWDTFEHTSQGVGHVRWYDTLGEAMASAEQHYAKLHQLGLVESNRDVVAPVATKSPRARAASTATATAERSESDPSNAKGNGKRGKRGVGVCSTILDCVKAASAKHPVTVEDVLEVLIEKFPERDPNKMRRTVAGFPSWIESYYKVKLHRQGKTYWIE